MELHSLHHAFQELFWAGQSAQAGKAGKALLKTTIQALNRPGHSLAWSHNYVAALMLTEAAKSSDLPAQ